MVETNEEIRHIKGKKEEESYSRLAAYCFPDTEGWTSRIFPLQFGDKAYGLFKDELLTSGTMTRNFNIYIFNTLMKMSGIAAVISSPQSRNRGYIRGLISKIVNDEKQEGASVSILMPFKHTFYQKFGYGYLGGTTATTIEPDNINALPLYEGEFVKFDGKKEHLTAMYDVHDIWVRNFTGGIKSRRLGITKFKEYIKNTKDHLFLYFKNNECKAYLLFHFNYKGFLISDIEINKAAWRDTEGFRGILSFLKTHRDQCRNIEWKVPRNIPLHILCKNPRITQKLFHDYMIRPLDVEKILTLKADYTPATEKITFSIEDPVIPGNSGTYIIEDKEVKKIPLNRENIVPFHIFSSLIFGAVSLKEAELAGLKDTSFPVTAHSFFQKNQNIYVSECF